MSESIRRRSSSRQLLQNLIRVTAQRSQEDAEEVERERRRRAREKQRGVGSPPWPVPTHHHNLTYSMNAGGELKPDCCLVLEEDEGFSDWSHRLENRTEQDVQDICRAGKQMATAPLWKPGSEEEKQKEEEKQEPVRRVQSRENSTGTIRTVEGQSADQYFGFDGKMSDSKKKSRASYSLPVFLPEDIAVEQTAGRPVASQSYLTAGSTRTSGWVCRVDGEMLQEELEEEVGAIQPSCRSTDLDDQQMPNKHDNAEAELIYTHEKSNDLHPVRAKQRLMEEDEVEERGEEKHKILEKRSVENSERKSEEIYGLSEVSPCRGEGQEPLNCYGPMSPTFKKLLVQFYPDEINSGVSTDGKCKINERAESLRRSTNNMKKTPPTVTVNKIDRKLEQYTHAIELSSKDGRLGGPTDTISPTEPVSSKKNLFEAGEAWNQNPSLVAASKDTDGFRVGVSDLIHQWMRGSEDGNGMCSSASKPAEIKPGGVLNKKNLWESLGDGVSPGRNEKENCPGKKYKFVVTGHGKYEKVDDISREDLRCQSATEFYEDL